MKIVTKIPAAQADVHAELINSKWHPLKEPANLIHAILWSLPFMVINFWIAVGAINLFASISLREFGLEPGRLSFTLHIGSIFALFFLLVVHEFIHLIFVPNFAKSKKTYVGIALFGAFVATEEEMSKTRFLIITIAPFVIISILLPLLLGGLGMLTTTFKCLIILNAMASSVDMLTFFLVLSQVPTKATIVSNGSKTYWKVK